MIVVFLLLYFITATTGSPKKINPRQALTSTSKEPVDISHKCTVHVHQLRLRSHRYQYIPKVRGKVIYRKPMSFRHGSKGHASYSTDLQYRGSVRLHVNSTNVHFFLRTFQDERPLYRKLTTSAFQENLNDVWENSNNSDIKARRIPNKLPVKNARFLSICVVDRTNAPWRTIHMLLLPWRVAVL